MEHRTCPICLEQIGDKNFCKTECGHEFCLKCLVSSCMQNNTNCPLCRKMIVPESGKVIELGEKVAECEEIITDLECDM